MLAESIGVSRRTVLRELPSVEQWIAAAGYRFVRSPGQGLLLDEPPARREQMRALLNGSTVYAELPRRQRRQKLLGMLLQAREPRKTRQHWRGSCSSPRAHWPPIWTKSGCGYPRMR